MAARKKDKLSSTSQLLNFARDSYLERTSRPIYAIIFLLPFIIFYEIGTILVNTDLLNQQLRVLAFIWLQDLLRYLHTGNQFAWLAPPLMAVVILLGFQIASHKPWWFCLSDFGPMVLECILLAVPLIVLSLFFNSSTAAPSKTSVLDRPPAVVCAAEVRAEPTRTSGWRSLSLAQPAPEPPAGRRSLMPSIVTSVGAGIYEELVFRLILICALMVLFQDVFSLDQKNAIILSVLISSALFSAHHHLAPGAAFSWTQYIFRTMAGVYFAVLFAMRGFGITAGTHAFYDIIATILNAYFFGR